MPGKAAKVKVSERQRDVLQELSRSRTTARGIVQRKCLRGGNFTSVADLESQLREFIIYYNTTMAHSFHWTYTGKPLQKTRRPHFVSPHRRVKMQGPHKLPSLTPS